MVDVLNNFPAGPLDYYRNSASFQWQKMKQFLYGDEIVKFQNRIYEELGKYPEILEIFSETPTLDNLRKITTRRMLILHKIEATIEDELKNGTKRFVYDSIIGALDINATIKHFVTFRLFANAIKILGTERHQHYLEKLRNLEILGCFALTEIAHGSNTRGMQTIATYDVSRKQFILNTPNFQAAKCWIGSLAKTATHSAVFANLITPDGVNQGLHCFVVPVRDPKTLLPYPGAQIYDMGEKIGFNGVDNGIVMFSNYAITCEALLNKAADVTEGGNYVTTIKDPIKRFAETLGGLLEGRLLVCALSTTLLTKSITIAIRYSGVRRQFSAEVGGEEIPILEYQSHQYRLLPHLATAYAFTIFAYDLFTLFFDRYSVDNPNKDPSAVDEMHAILAASKPLMSWASRDGIQECRECCGGHGFLKAAGIGDLRKNNDALVTVEGDNYVLVQQTSNWLLKFWPLVMKRQFITTPLDSIAFLNNAEIILKSKVLVDTVEDVIDPKYILNTFQWLVCYLLKTCYESRQVADYTKNTIQNRMQKLVVVFIQHHILQHMLKKISTTEDLELKNVFLKLFSLCGIFSLLKHIPILYMGEYANGPNTAKFMQNAVLLLCANLKNDAIAIVDAIAPADCVTASVLGYSDGQVYKHLETTMLNAPGALERPSWWKEIVSWKDVVKAKL